MNRELSTFRLYLLRFLYLMNFVGLGSMVWPEIIRHQGTWDPIVGVAWSFWGALSLLMGLGIRYPLQMLPVPLLQLVYKLIWLVIVALPLWLSGETPGLARIFIIGIVADLVAIPWGYVIAHYVRKPGDRWRPASAPALSPS